MDLKHLQEMTLINEAGGGFFTEAKGYDDSGEFTNEFYDLFGSTTKMKKVMKNPKWIEYMKLTDYNLGTMAEAHARDAIKAVVALEKALQAIDEEFDRANGHSDDGEGMDEPVDDAGGADTADESKPPRGASSRNK